MDPNPNRFPILSYVLARLQSFSPKGSYFHPEDDRDIERPSPAFSPKQNDSSTDCEIETQMPQLTDPIVLESMKRAITEVAETRSVLRVLGERPDHETVDRAKMKLAEIDADLSGKMDEVALSPGSADIEGSLWRDGSPRETDKGVEKEKQAYQAIIRLDEMHEAYEKLLKDAEQRLAKIYESAEDTVAEEVPEKEEEVNEEVVGILQEALGKGLERIDLSNRRLRYMPEAFGRIISLVALNVSSNRLKVIPDSIAGLENLEELNVSSNVLQSLPDSIGLMQKLKILNISGNKLESLPDTICHCRSLVELDASYNYLSYLPTNLGLELSKLQKLSVHCNKLRSLPSSVCEMNTLRYLDAHFNELHGLPVAVGRLSNLEYLNLSSNFSDMRELPESFGDLINLKELDLSNNQILALPDSFGRLENLVKLNLEQNPLVVPPQEIAKQGTEAVKSFMTQRWRDILIEEEKKKNLELEDQGTNGWLSRSTSWLKNYVAGVSEHLPSSPKDPYLDQQL